jgi:glucose/arabinose dehydrogenase
VVVSVDVVVDVDVDVDVVVVGGVVLVEVVVVGAEVDVEVKVEVDVVVFVLPPPITATATMRPRTAAIRMASAAFTPVLIPPAGDSSPGGGGGAPGGSGGPMWRVGSSCTARASLPPGSDAVSYLRFREISLLGSIVSPVVGMLHFAGRMCSARIVAGSLCAGVALLASSGVATASTSTLPPGFQDEAVIDGLNLPTVFDFASDGQVFAGEKGGVIKEYDSIHDQTPTVVADLSTDVYDFHDRGLIGLAVDPRFPKQPYVYALYTRDQYLPCDDPELPSGALCSNSPPPRWNDQCPDPSESCVASGELVRLTLDKGNQMTDSKPLITDWCQQFSEHSIADLEFDKSGALYAGAGEAGSAGTQDYGQFGNPCGDPLGHNPPPTAQGGALRAQDMRTENDPTTLDGSIIRVNPSNGDPLPSNPHYGHGDLNAQRIVAYGLRNPFRFGFRPGTNELWIGDVGWGHYEELDLDANPLAGQSDFGWPCYEGPKPEPGYQSFNFSLCNGLYASGAAVKPYFTYEHECDSVADCGNVRSGVVVPGDGCDPSRGAAISGLAFYRGQTFPAQYRNAFFFSDYARGCIWYMRPDADGHPDPGTLAPFDYAPQPDNPGDPYDVPGPVDLKTGPGGKLYYADINHGEIRAVSYVPGKPVATIQASTQTPCGNPQEICGDVPLKVQFDGTQSSDPNGEALSYEWDLDGDGQFDDGSAPTAKKTYSDGSENVDVRLKVTDTHGATDIAHETIYPGDTAPQPTISSPSPSTKWSVGDEIDFSGSAADAEEPGGMVDPSDLNWRIELLHCPGGKKGCHTHYLQSVSATDSGSFIAPDHDYPAHLVIQMTATDGRGLSDTATLTLDPEPARLTLASKPKGVALGLDDMTARAPFATTEINGSSHTLNAPKKARISGDRYRFKRWRGDGRSTTRSVTLTGDTTYKAIYKR